MISFAAVLSIAYVAACGLLWATQESLLFFPRALAHPPTHPAAESVEIERPDALLRGWVVNAGQAGPVIVYFGGNAEEVSVNIGDFAELRATTVLINYRGYGESTGKPSEQHLVGDAVAVSEWARERFSGRPLVLFGSSLGTGIAVLAAAQVGPDAAVLLSPYRSIARVAQKHFRVFPVRWMIRHPFRAESVVGAMPPTLVIRVVGGPDRPLRGKSCHGAHNAGCREWLSGRFPHRRRSPHLDARRSGTLGGG